MDLMSQLKKGWITLIIPANPPECRDFGQASHRSNARHLGRNSKEPGRPPVPVLYV